MFQKTLGRCKLVTLNKKERREKRDRHYSRVSYECDNCGLCITGHSADLQEAPWLYCPWCDVEMSYALKGAEGDGDRDE